MTIIKITIAAVAAAVIAITTSACSGAHGYQAIQGSEHGIFVMQGDARGIEAFSQGIHGIVEGAKHEKGETPYATDVYKTKSSNRTIVATTPGLFGSLFNNNQRMPK